MTIAISTNGFSEYSIMSERMGQCNGFILYNTVFDHYERLENIALTLDESRGLQAIRYLYKNNVKVILTWNIGKPAFDEAQKLGIKIYLLKEQLIVKKALEMYLNNEIDEKTECPEQLIS